MKAFHIFFYQLFVERLFLTSQLLKEAEKILTCEKKKIRKLNLYGGFCVPRGGWGSKEWHFSLDTKYVPTKVVFTQYRYSIV